MLDFKTLLQPVSIQCHSFPKQRKECILFSHFPPFSQSHWTRALCGLKYFSRSFLHRLVRQAQTMWRPCILCCQGLFWCQAV